MIDVSVITAKKPVQERTERIRAFSTNYLVNHANLTALKKLVARYGTRGEVCKELFLDNDLVLKAGEMVIIRRLRYADLKLGAIVERLDGNGAEEVDLAKLLRTTVSYEGAFVIPHKGKNLKVVGREHPYRILRSDIAELIKAIMIQCIRIREKDKNE